MDRVLNNMELCYGCGACANKCPKGAITMEPNEFGFLYPEIDKEKCVDCKLCQKVCPAISQNYSNDEEPTAYAFAMNEKVLYDSSSGGAFTLLAEEMFRKDGYVVGVTFDKDFKVGHELICSNKELDKLRRSKYVQSNTRSTYKETEKLLLSGKAVLYSGCPCQIAGLKKYLGREYDNLFTIDLICHGVPSQKYLDEYLEHNYDIAKIKDVSFRTRDGWGVVFDVTMKDGSVIKKSKTISEYMKGFLKDIALRKSCYTCKFNCIPRQGDFTVGDLWTAAKMNLSFPYQKGVSVVLVNNDKGKLFWEQAVENISSQAHIQLLPSLKGLNANIFKSSLHNISDEFEKNYKKMSFEEAVNVTLHKHDVGMMLYMSNNYGSIATNFALYKVLESMGKTAVVLDNLRPLPKDASAFAKKYMKVSSRFLERDSWKMANAICDTFIVGSDMSWNWDGGTAKRAIEYMMLGFTDDTKRRISYAPSFGREKTVMDESHRILCKYYLSRFHAISVREDYGVNMCKNLFELEAKQVLDPVFMCDEKYYYELITDSKIDTSEEYLLAYILNPTPGKRKVLLDTAKRLGKKLVVLLDIEGDYQKNKNSMNLDEFVDRPDMVDWLAYFANASYIITDSFHGCCFSVLFKKPFVGIKNRSKQRFDSLANLIGVQSIFYEDAKPLLDNKDFFVDLDYDEIHRRLDVRKKDCLDWLQGALEKEVKTENNSYELSMEYAKLLRSRNFNLEIATKYKAEELYNTRVEEELETADTFLNAVYRANNMDYIADEITKTDNLAKYFETIRSRKYYTVVLSCKDSCSRYWNEFITESRLVVGVMPSYRNGLCIVINNDDILYEETSDKMLVCNCVSIKIPQSMNVKYDEENAHYIIGNSYMPSYIKIISAGYDETDKTSKSEIIVNNIDFSMNERGINIVVIDNRYGKVIDSFNVDTHADVNLRMVRK